MSATATYAPTRDLLFSLTVPALERSLHDVASRTSTLIPGDVDARVYGVASRTQLVVRALFDSQITFADIIR